MVNVDAEVSKHKNCKDRDELSRVIKDYKDLAFQHASDMITAGQYNMVAMKLQEICDKMPAPRLKRIPGHTDGAPTKTTSISKEEKARINADWRKKTGGSAAPKR
ncbi:MAG: hypothetical protein FWB83_04775 [Treponema sp.]|nr:hypothetical protein [Treponema sp.]MCL2180423.1 hypothetical protein [Treponema sp.]